MWHRMFSGAEPEDFRIEPDPLAAVMVRIQFPTAKKMAKASVAAEIQSDLQHQYPILHDIDKEDSSDERFYLHDRPQSWFVTFADSEILLRTTKYGGRPDLLDRVAKVVATVERNVAPVNVEGVRLSYLNVFPFGNIEDDTFVADIPYRPMNKPLPGGWDTCHSRSVFHFRNDDQDLRVAFGQADGLADFDTFSEKSWIIEIMSSDVTEASFDRETIVEALEREARLCYRAFRAFVSPDFLERHRK